MVQDNEPLVRILHDRYINKKGELRPGAFSLTDLRDRGSSLIRLKHVSSDRLVNLAAEIIIAAKAQEVKGALVACAKDLRSIYDSEDRALCVKDDPVVADEKLSDNPAHAITMTTTQKTDDELLALRDLLLQVFSKVEKLSDF